MKEKIYKQAYETIKEYVHEFAFDVSKNELYGYLIGVCDLAEKIIKELKDEEKTDL